MSNDTKTRPDPDTKIGWCAECDADLYDHDGMIVDDRYGYDCPGRPGARLAHPHSNPIHRLA